MQVTLSLVVFLLTSFLPSLLGLTVGPTAQTPTTTTTTTPPTPSANLSLSPTAPEKRDESLTTPAPPSLTSSSINVTTTAAASASAAAAAAAATTSKGGLAVSSSLPLSSSSSSAGEEMLVLEEVGRLLGQMREVAASMQEARDEHSRLAQAVAQISAAVRDMGEHNLHIKKKVRKMSKALRGGTHHRKVKDGLKSLQRDHQRILHAMSVNGINVTRVHNHNHTHNGTHKNNHHNHNRNHHNNNNNSTSSSGQSGKSSSSSSSEEKKKKKNKSSEGRHVEDGKEGETPRNVSLESGAASSSSSSSSPGGESQETQVSQETTLPEAIVTDNLIPDLVVDPPGATDPPLPVDCTEVMQRGNWTSGSYMIQPRGLQQPIKVWCDHTTNGGGWTIMLARMEQETQENFDRNWTEYKNGFGEVTGEHWIGLDAMHAMVKGRNHELRVNITDWSDNEAWAEWKEFSVAGEEHLYRLKVNRYASGSQAGDALKWHNTMKFSTPDRDNDAIMGHNCAKKNHGGWWYRGYRGCYQAHPTGRFQRNPSPPPRTPANSRNFDLGPVLVWQNWRGEDYYPKALFLMFRPSLN